MARRLTTILAADLAGYSRLMAADEEGVITRLRAARTEVLVPEIAKANGRIVKTMGDGLLVEFPSPVAAVSAALAVQAAMAVRETGPEEKQFRFRIGINLGDIVTDGDDILGDEVNVAARLEGLADPGGLCISGAVYDQVRGKVVGRFTPMGLQRLKNIPMEIEVWRVTSGPNLEPAGSIMEENRPSVAVLPFENMSNDVHQSYLCRGMAEDIIADLSRFHGLRVIARNSSFAVAEANDISGVARALGVRYVIAGSVRKSEQRIRISVRLVDAAERLELWAERFDRVADDVFDLQDEISRAVVGRLAPTISDAEMNRAMRLRPSHLGAYDRALRARERALAASFENEGAVAVEAALTLAHQAIAIDPRCSLAHATVLECLLWDVVLAWSPEQEEKLKAAAEAAETLRRVDPGDHQAYFFLGRVSFLRKRHDDAISFFRRALELNPNDARTLVHLAWAEGSSGLPDDAITHAEQALILSPQDPETRYMSYWNLALSALVKEDYLAGVAFGRRSRLEMPRHPGVLGILAANLAESGETEEAKSVIAELLRISPDYIKDRLHGNTYFKSARDHDRYVGALRKAAGDLYVS